MSPEDRKRNSETLLKKNGIPYIDWLPLTESDEVVEPRKIKEIGVRIICLFCLTGTAFEEAETVYIDYLKQHNLWESLSREEKTYLSNPTYGNQAQINATWRIEALFLLLWSVGVVPELPFPPKEADVDDFIDSLPSSDEDPHNFINSLELRSIPEIMDASDLIYRLHWASKQQDCPSTIDGGVVREWHHAINWLTNYDGESWDWVATDT